MSDEKNLVSIASNLKPKTRNLETELEPYLSELSTLVAEGTSLRVISQSLDELGVHVSHTYIAKFLQANFPTKYEQMYSARAPGGKKQSKTSNTRIDGNKKIVEGTPKKLKIEETQTPTETESPAKEMISAFLKDGDTLK